MRLLPSKLKFPLLLLLLILPSVFFLFQNSIYFNMHDDMQLIRQMEMDRCFADGQIPCRWTPDLGYGYGYPLFNYYPPLPYLVGHGIKLFGFSYINTIKFTFALQFFVLAAGSYSLSLLIFKNRLSALLVALMVNYAPYHAVNVYVRGAQNESWALAFFPWIIFFGLKLIKSPSPLNLLGLAFSSAFLLLSHLPMSLVFFPSAVFLCLVIYFSQNSFRRSKLPKLLPFFLSLALGLLLSAFFILPANIESKFVQIESMFSEYYHFSVHFTSLKQLFISNFWGDGPSVWGQADLMSFSVGYLQWLIPLVSFGWLVRNWLSSKKLPLPDLFIFLSLIFGITYTFLTHQRSDFIWYLIPPLQKIQFPWRLLNPAVFYLSFSVGWLITCLPTQKLKNSFSAVFIFLLLALNLPKFYPVTYGPITDEQKFSGPAWTTQITSGHYDYLPLTSPKYPDRPPRGIIDSDSSELRITGSKQGTDWGLVNLSLLEPQTVTLGILTFPGLSIWDNGVLITSIPDKPYGRPQIALSSGNHQIYYHYQNTPLRTISNLLTLSGLLIVFILVLPGIKYHALNLRRSKN